MGKKGQVVIKPEDVGSAAEVLGPIASSYTDEQKVADDIVNKMAFETALDRAIAAREKSGAEGPIDVEITAEDVGGASGTAANLPSRPEAYLTRWETEVKPLWDQFHPPEEAA